MLYLCQKLLNSPFRALVTTKHLVKFTFIWTWMLSLISRPIYLGEQRWRSGESARLPRCGLASHVGWVCCWFSSLFRRFFSRFSGFCTSTQTNTPNSNSVSTHVCLQNEFLSSWHYVDKQITVLPFLRSCDTFDIPRNNSLYNPTSLKNLYRLIKRALLQNTKILLMKWLQSETLFNDHLSLANASTFCGIVGSKFSIVI